MSEKELKKWLIDKFNSCYQVKYDKYKSTIFFYYDESYLRKMKLRKLENNDINLSNDVSGECLFYININNKVLYYDSVKICIFISNNRNKDDIDTKMIIRKTFNSSNKLSEYSTFCSFGTIIQVDPSNEHKITKNEFIF